MLEVVTIAVEQGFNVSVSGGGTVEKVPSDEWGDY